RRRGRGTGHLGPAPLHASCGLLEAAARGPVLGVEAERGAEDAESFLGPIGLQRLMTLVEELGERLRLRRAGRGRMEERNSAQVGPARRRAALARDHLQ